MLTPPKGLLLAFILLYSMTGSAQEILICSPDGDIYQLDLLNCTTNFICSVGGAGSTYDMTFHPNGSLYVIAGSGDLSLVDPTNCSTTFIHHFNGPQIYNSLVTDANGLFYATGTQGKLWTYNLATDQETYLGNIGFPAAGDLTFNNGVLYMAAKGDQIIKVNLQHPGQSTVLADFNVGGNIYGIFSYLKNCNTLQSLVVAGQNIYELDISSAALHYVCSIPFDAGGAASTYEFLGSSPINILQVDTQDPVCTNSNGMISLDVSGGSGQLLYSIDGINYQTGNVFNNLPSGIYTIYIKDQNNCPITLVDTLTNSLAPDISLNFVQATCGENNGSISVTGGGGAGMLQYSIDNVNFLPQGSFTNLPGGLYTVVVQDEHGCKSTQDVVIPQTGLPNVHLIDQNLCKGEQRIINNILFNDQNPTGTIVIPHGSFYGCDSVIEVHLTFHPAQFTEVHIISCHPVDTGIVVRKLTGWLGCDSTVTITTALNPDLIPKPGETETDPPCPGNTGSISVQVMTGGTAPFAFQLDNHPPQADGLFNAVIPGTHTVQVTDAMGCGASVSATVEPAPELTVSLLPEDLTIQSGDTIRLITVITPTGLMQGFSWSDTRGLSCAHCLDPLATPNRDVVYSINVAYDNGCLATASTKIKVISKKQFFLPNAFKPSITSLTLYGVDDLEQILDFQIYDRWGGLIFSKQHFQPNDPGVGWDGTWQGKEVPAGVYVATVKLQFLDGEVLTVVKDVTLVR